MITMHVVSCEFQIKILMETAMTKRINSTLSKNLTWIRMLGLSSIGIFIFFISITVSGKQTIPLDHMVYG